MCFKYGPVNPPPIFMPFRCRHDEFPDVANRVMPHRIRWFAGMALPISLALLAACSKQPVAQQEAPVAPPNLAIFDAKGVALKDGSILEGVATEAAGDLWIKGGLQVMNTGGPVAGPLQLGWRLPKDAAPLKSLAPASLAEGGEFAYEVASSNPGGRDGIESTGPGDKKFIGFLCELEPGLWLPPEIPVEYFIRRAGDSTDLLHMRLRLHPQWPLDYQPVISASGATVVERTQNEGQKDQMIDVDWRQKYRFNNRSHSVIGALNGYFYLKARKPFDAPSAALPLVSTGAAVDPSNWAGANYPAGFTAIQAWNPGGLVLQPGETPDDWSAPFDLGRGSYIPPGKHDVAVEIRARGAVVHRSFYKIEVPEGLPFPSIDLVGEDGQSLVPGSKLPAVVDQRPPGKPSPDKGAAREIALSFPVQLVASQIRPADKIVNVAEDLTWMLLVGDKLHPPPQTSASAEVLGLEGLPYYELLDSGNLAALSDGKPHQIQLQFPLDPALAQPKAGQPGLWIEPGIREVRLVAFPAKRKAIVVRQMLQGRRPDRDLLLFERDFALDVQQSGPIELDAPH